MLPRPSASPAIAAAGSPEHSSEPSPHGGARVWRIVRIVLALFLLALGGLYFWGAYLDSQEAGDFSPTPSRSA